MCYVDNAQCDGCADVATCIRIDDGVYCVDCARTNEELADEFRDDDMSEVMNDEEREIAHANGYDMGEEVGIVHNPEFDYDEYSEYDEWQDYMGGDEPYMYEGTDFDFGMDG